MTSRRGIARSIPLGRVGHVDEVAKAMLYLASDDASHVTGARHGPIYRPA